MGRGDAEAEDVSELGVDRGLVFRGTTEGFLTAGGGFDAAPDKAHDLFLRPSRFGYLYIF